MSTPHNSFKDTTRQYLVEVFCVVFLAIVTYVTLHSTFADTGLDTNWFLTLCIALVSSLMSFPFIKQSNITKQQYNTTLVLYDTMLKANQAINTSTDEIGLFSAIINIVTDQRDFAVAAVCKRDPTSLKLSPIVHTGCFSIDTSIIDCNYIATVGTAVTNQHPLPHGHPWKSYALFPIQSSNQDRLYLVVYSSKEDTFTNNNLELLSELSKHMGFAVDAYATNKLNQTVADQYMSLLDTTVDGFWVVDTKGKIINVNNRYCLMTGYTRSELLSMYVWDVSTQEKEEILQSLNNFRTEYPGGLIHTTHETKSGQLIDIEINCTYQASSGVFISFLRDITERKRTEHELKTSIEKIQWLAFRDPLTTLPNRTLFHDRFDIALSTAKRRNTKLAVLVIDLDNFKQVNDSLGHAGGDFLLSSVSQRMSSCIRECDTLARLGGDEFGLIIDNIPDDDTGTSTVEYIAGKLIDVVHQPLEYEGVQMYMSISVGVATYPDHGSSRDELLKQADRAMYGAKNSGRNGYQLYSNRVEMLSPVSHLEIRNGLYRALENNEIVVYYQPQLQLSTNRLAGAEALVRWADPSHGLISPICFMPVAEATNLVSEIGERVMTLACSECVKWHHAGCTELSIAVNLSVRQFVNKQVLHQVEKVLSTTGLSPSALELEITETMTMQDSEQMGEVLQALKDMGASISMDDFGTGYSSLSYLTKYPMDVVKIDQSFVRNMLTNSNHALLVVAIIQMAKGMNIKTVAEGVETVDQLNFLREHGCDLAQGYLISKPIPADEFYNKFITSNKTLTF